MRILIAEDDMVSRQLLLKFLSQYGECDMVVDGLETLEAFLMATKENKPYDLICLDIMMPKVNGVKALKAIRDLEAQNRILPKDRTKVIIITALAETEMVQQAFEIGCEAYMAKPINIGKLAGIMEELGLKSTE